LGKTAHQGVTSTAIYLPLYGNHYYKKVNLLYFKARITLTLLKLLDNNNLNIVLLPANVDLDG